jgi:tRNA pseudouridine13 synthase
MSYVLDMPYAYGGPLGSATFRSQLTDFVVIENLGMQPEGEGEHHYLYLEKRGVNTDWVAQKIARVAGVKSSDIGFCGLKDRHAVASQWFSIYLPKGPAPDWTVLQDEAIKLIEVTAGKRKLRRGQHKSNRFIITLRDINNVAGEELQGRLQTMVDGVPNYFGEQRFGRDGGNLVSAARWLEQGAPLNKMRDKGMVMSAARSHIFNLVLAERVRRGNWREALPGDVNSAATGPLWGRGRNPVSADTLAQEEHALADHRQWLAGLEHCGLMQERRSLRLVPQEMRWTMEQQNLILEFALAPGEFATAVLREIFHLQNVSV